jgi:hypothetical protein
MMTTPKRPSRILARRLAVLGSICLFTGATVGCVNRSRIGDIFHGGGTGSSDGGPGGAIAAGSGGMRGTGGSPFPDGGLNGDRHITTTSKLDVLFMVDDSSSMRPIQASLAASVSQFVNGLKGAAGGLPDLHLAVISSSLGAGAFGDVPGCGQGAPGDDGGSFQHRAGCGLNPGANFITASADGSANNFSGDLAGVFGCLAQLGDGGCGFEHQLESVRQALIRASDPMDQQNGGFLRDDAYLSIVMLTNEDDCSVPANSQLFDTSVTSLSDKPPLGGLWSYRCNEFGHRCDQPMPHTTVGLPAMLTGCMSKENTDGLYHLTPVADFVDFLGRLKSDPNRVSVAALMGPPSPYVVTARTAQLASGGTELQPQVEHSCSLGSGVNADPSIRLTQWLEAFGPNGTAENICVDDLGPAVTRIANHIVGGMNP